MIFQRTTSNISEVLPGPLLIFNIWNKLSEKKRFTTICDLLIDCFKEKFKYELNSDVYLTAALMNVTKLPLWYWKSSSSDYVNRASNILLKIMEEYCLKETSQNNKEDTNKSKKSLFLNKNDDDLLFSLAQEEISQCKNEN